MPTLLLEFPARRYHATPAGHHVNEGQVEWPPSPWRLLRALLSVGYTALQWPSGSPPAEARRLIEKLAGALPEYSLPKASGAHSRHYMPLAAFKNGKEETTLVFDTWAHIAGGTMSVTWPVELDAEETGLFGRLAVCLNYLGRSESWVSARLAEPHEPLPVANCRPARDGATPARGWEYVTLLAPQAPELYSAWRERELAQVLADLPLPAGGRKLPAALQKKRDKAAAPYPGDLIAALQANTNELRQYGWSQAPGSLRVPYQRESDSFEPASIPARPASLAAAPVQSMLFAMATESGNDHALPPLARTLPQAERAHRQIVHALAGTNCPALTGNDAEHRPLTGPHGHAHLLPLDLDDDGHLDHLLIWAPMGLDAGAQAAVRTLRQTYAKGGAGPIKLALAAAGGLQQLRGLQGPWGGRIAAMLQPARSWISRTPFVPPRHLKERGVNTLEGQIQAELASRGYPAAARVALLHPGANDHARNLRHFVRRRANGPQPPVDCGFALTLEFSLPIQGPLCLGYASHFGLGQFVPAACVAPSATLET
ncbi:MAG: type I-U CRISPR-associated protein Cas5/Cas6 [Rhodocyclaceae bacterium]|nr:type I-U CRISPR-associated protein Cas5/Cas6 [Rhodocyclaceae bacterium]